MMFLWFVQKMSQALTFLATIENDHRGHESSGRYFDSGAAHDFRSGLHRPDSDERPADRSWGELNASFEVILGAKTMLSVDQFLRLISIPAVVAAFLIASQISGAGIFHSPQVQMASE
jgi:hypothetical protein